MPLKILKRGRGKYSVVNIETGKVHSYATTLQKAKRQVRLINAYETKGDGFFDSARRLLDRLSFKKREAGVLPPQSRELLARIRNEPIVSLVIVRTPIESFINQALQFISGGTWQDAVRKTGYDKIFHLSLFINNKYTLHKIEVATLAEGNPIKPTSQTMPITPNSESIGELIDTTLRTVGGSRFSEYNPVSQNCQDFLIDVLQSNGLLTPDAMQFIKQDAQTIFQNMPQFTAKIATAATDLGARFNRLIYGESIKNKDHLLQKVKHKLEELQIPYESVELSPLKGKKIRIKIHGKNIDFGAKNSITFLEGASESKRNAYRKRHSQIMLKDGTRAINVQYSPAWLSWHVLW